MKKNCISFSFPLFINKFDAHFYSQIFVLDKPPTFCEKLLTIILKALYEKGVWRSEWRRLGCT